MPPTRVHAYRRSARAVAIALQLLALGNLLELAARLATDVFAPGEVERLPLSLLVRRTFSWTALPLLALALIRWISRGTLDPDGERATLAAEGTRTAITLAGSRRWRLSLPEPGFDVPGLPWAIGRVDREPLWRHFLLRLGLVPALLTVLLYRLHAVITYGGPLGEWRMLGPRHFLRTLSGVALYAFCTAFVCAAVLRVLVELVSHLRPALRERAKAAAAILWYGGIAAALAARLLF